MELQLSADKKIANRFRDFRISYIDKNQTRAAEKLGLFQGTLSKMESGKLAIDFDLVAKLVKDYKLNPDWLATGSEAPIDKDPPKNKLIKDINLLNEEMDILKRSIKMIEANHNHMLKILEQQGATIERLEKQLNQK